MATTLRCTPISCLIASTGRASSLPVAMPALLPWLALRRVLARGARRQAHLAVTSLRHRGGVQLPGGVKPVPRGGWTPWRRRLRSSPPVPLSSSRRGLSPDTSAGGGAWELRGDGPGRGRVEVPRLRPLFYLWPRGLARQLCAARAIARATCRRRYSHNCLRG